MTLTPEQMLLLDKSIGQYCFPTVFFDFERDEEIYCTGMAAVENKIYKQITSKETKTVKDGLSNILYWGYARVGYRETRINKFRKNITKYKLKHFIHLLESEPKLSLISINKIKMPEYSGMSFVSKIRMFLDPATSATLDKQIVRIKFLSKNTVLNQLSHTKKESQIRISKPNSQAYEAWCNELTSISNTYYEKRFRAVDVERGLFNLVQCNHINDAVRILHSA
jgi:hypothetical protein